MGKSETWHLYGFYILNMGLLRDFMGFLGQNRLQVAMDPQRKELPRPPVAPAVADEIVQARHGTRLAIQALSVLG